MYDLTKASRDFLNGLTEYVEYMAIINKLIEANPKLAIELAWKLAETEH